MFFAEWREAMGSALCTLYIGKSPLQKTIHIVLGYSLLPRYSQPSRLNSNAELNAELFMLPAQRSSSQLLPAGKEYL
jgi:hypothetical protein